MTMGIKRKYTERGLPYGSKAMRVECDSFHRGKVKFKAFKFMDGYFDFLESNSLSVLGYRLQTIDNMSDILYVAYRPADCDSKRLESETRRYFKSVYKADLTEIKIDTYAFYSSKYRIFTDYSVLGFSIPVASDIDEFESYLIDELHLTNEFAEKHADNIYEISDYKWRSTKPANNWYKKYPTDIEKYVSTLFLADSKNKELEKDFKTSLTLYLRFKQFGKEKSSKTNLKAYQATIKKIVGYDVELKPQGKPIDDKNLKKIRVDINMDDIDEFLDYLERRVPNRNTRKKYVERIRDLNERGWNSYRHSTFIDDNKYKVSAKDIEVFVNGIKSKDFDVSVKEFEDALELYLSYRWEKDYNRPLHDDKDEAIPPLVKERSKKKQEVAKQKSTEGKKIFATISHLDSWDSSKKDKDTVPSSGQGVVYVGNPEGQRKSKTLQNASISESEASIDVTINLNEHKGPMSEDPIAPKNTNNNDVLKDDDVKQEEEVKEKINEEKKQEPQKKEKKKSGWFARIMLRFWVWFYKISPKKT